MLQSKKSWCLIFMAVCLLVLTLVATRPGFIFNQIFPTSAPHLVGISIAISEFEFGLQPAFTGYMKINKFLLDYTRSVCRYETCTYEHLNAAIAEVLRMKDVGAEGLHFMFGVDPGMPILYKLAFMSFGYRAEAIYFFVFLIFSISVLLFLLAYRQRLSLLFFLNVFLVAHLVVAICAPFTSADLQVIFHDRFLPVYGVLPTFHLLLAALNPRADAIGWQQKILLIIPLIVQASILSLVTHARFAALGFVIAVILLPVAIKLLNWFRKKTSILTSWVPAICLIVIFIGFRAFIFTGLHPNYTKYGERPFHGFWHNFYLGLGGHPEAKERYDIAYDDLTGFRTVARLAPKHGYTFTVDDHISNYGFYVIGAPPSKSSEVIIQGKRYSEVLATEYFRILWEDPLFVVSSYFYKIPLFFRVFLMQEGEGIHDHFGVTRFIFHPVLLIGVLLSFFLARTGLAQDWSLLFSLLGYTWFFSLLAPLAVMPLSYLIADASLILVMLIYIFILYGLWRLVSRSSSQS